MAMDFFTQGGGGSMLDLLKQTFAQAGGGGGGGFGGLGGYSVSPGFALNALPVLANLERQQKRQSTVDRLLAGGPAEIARFTGVGGGADPTQTILQSMLADIGAEEGTKSKRLESRFSSLGRSLSSTAFSDAARQLAEAFGRQRLAAQSQATQVGSRIKMAGDQLQNQRLGLLLSLI